MGRHASYTPSPPRGYGRRYRSPSPVPRYGGRPRDLPTSLLVRNLSRSCRPEDLRGPFGRFGRIKDIYLPRDYYTGEPRGFGFVQYLDPRDAEDAKYHLDGYVILGREITVVFAEENRKKPSEMRHRDRVRSQSYGRSASRGRSRSPRRYSRSPSYERSYSGSPGDYCRSPVRHSRSISPRERRYRERSFGSPYGSRSISPSRA